MTVTSVRLQPDVERRLEQVANRQRRSKSWLINQALREYVQREQLEQDRWKDTLAALDDVVAGRVVSGSTVHTWLRTWGNPSEPKAPRAKR